MDESLNKEIKYLRGKFCEVLYDSNRFKLFIGKDKFLFGVFSPEGENAPFSKLMNYKTMYDTLIDLDWKIKISFDKGIEYAYSNSVQDNFNIIQTDSQEEKLAYYYIENALFRTSTLWDILAQLYCLFYDIEIKSDSIYYKRLFNTKKTKYKMKNFEEFKKQAQDINNYLEQEDNTKLEGEWKGNNKYIRECRNKMTHRNSPNITVISDYDFNFKDHPAFMLKRIVEDYSVVSKYIDEILNIIEEELIQNLKQI